MDLSHNPDDTYEPNYYSENDEWGAITLSKDFQNIDLPNGYSGQTFVIVSQYRVVIDEIQVQDPAQTWQNFSDTGSHSLSQNNYKTILIYEYIPFVYNP